MRGYYNVAFTGACTDSLIVLAESNGLRWSRNGSWVTLFGIGREILDIVMEKAQTYRTF